MRSFLRFATAVLIPFGINGACAKTVLSVSYPNPSLYKATLEEITLRFEASHPDIEISLRAPYATGGEVLSDLLRSKITGGSPDIAVLNMNYVGLLAERGIATPLDSIIPNHNELESLGYFPSVLSLGTVSSKLYGSLSRRHFRCFTSTLIWSSRLGDLWITSPRPGKVLLI
ncbi:extracellular solute-binding protein [Bradyrhizobium sp. USDA 4529]